MDPRRTLRNLVAPAAVVALLLTAWSAPASAAITVDPTYNAGVALAGGCHMFGSSDENGVFYTTSCDNKKLLRYDRNGTKLADIELPYTAGWFGAKNYTLATPYDVAPSPDGAFLYLTQGTKTPVRLNRQADGSYKLDANWKLQPFPAGGKNWLPIGWMLTTDGHGDIYLSNGSYWVSNDVPTPSMIAKFQPDGTFLTAFGAQGPQVGEWNTNQDVAVSRDGRRVYVGENCGIQCISGRAGYQPSRISRFDYTPNGQYKFTHVISAQGPNSVGCEAPGATHSAYTLALDAFDNLYAMSVSCGYLQQFATNADPAKEKFTKTLVKNLTAGGAGVKNHQIGVDWSGRVYAQEWKLKFAPKTPQLPAMPRPAVPPLPAPDVTAPTLTNVGLPATTTTQDVQVTITANDNVAVTEMRFANEDGNYGPWQPFVTPVTHRLSNGYAVKGVFVQVRDMAGNESNQVYKTLGYVAPDNGGGGAPAPVPNGDKVAPVVASATAPAVTATRDITIAIDATDDTGVKAVRFANEDGNWGAWKAFAPQSTWTITDGYLNKLIFVQVRDAAGNESNVVTTRTRYAADAPPPNPNPGAPADVTAPTLTRIELPAETTIQTLNVAITANDNVAVAQIRFANEDGNWTNWQAYANPKAWTLSANFGPKLVFAQVRDAAGNESLTVTARTQFVKTAAGPLDNADPNLTAVTLPETVPNANVTVKLTATDDVGVKEVRFANEDGTWGAWKAYGDGNVAHTLTAGNTYKVVFAQVRDAAGRESNVLYTRTLVQP